MFGFSLNYTKSRWNISSLNVHKCLISPEKKNAFKTKLILTWNNLRQLFQIRRNFLANTRHFTSKLILTPSISQTPCDHTTNIKRQDRNPKGARLKKKKKKSIKREKRTTWSQSTSCCSLRLTSSPVAKKWAPSNAPVVLKDQHEPHEPYTQKTKLNFTLNKKIFK